MKRIFIFCSIVVIAAFLRLYDLDKIPASPDWDEVSLGYNAYSILKTGKDEFGSFLPMTVRSFNDYKPPLYMYLTVPSVALFGLNVWSVRLISAIFGIITVISTYFFVKELFRYGLQRVTSNEHIALLSAFLLAISPWHIQFSRVAFEANIGVTLNIFGVYFFLRAIQKPWYFFLSAIACALTFYTYHSERVFVPSLIIILVISFWRVVWKNKKTFLISCLLGLIFLLPFLLTLKDANVLSRLGGTSTFRKQTEILERSAEKYILDKQNHFLAGVILNNRRLEWIKTIAKSYLSHYSLRWLFLTGDQPRHHAPHMGLLYFWEIPFLFIGIVLLWKNFHLIKTFLLGWLALAPVAASITYDVPHAVRTLVFLPVFQILTAIGCVGSVMWVNKLRNTILRIGIIVIAISIISANIFYYLHMYFVHTNREYASDWQYGYEQTVAECERIKDRYEKIIVSTDLEQPYIFFLFYTKYNPIEYLASGGSNRKKIDKYEFRPIQWDNEVIDGKTLFVASPKEIPDGNIKTILYPDGQPAMVLADRR